MSVIHKLLRLVTSTLLLVIATTYSADAAIVLQPDITGYDKTEDSSKADWLLGEREDPPEEPETQGGELVLDGEIEDGDEEPDGDDRTEDEKDDSRLRGDGEWDEKDEVYDGPTVQSITPDFRGWVKEYQELNADTVGWIYIPDTDINQVVVKNPEHLSNEYYLNVDFYGNPDKNGTFCTDRRAQFGSGKRSELSRNTTIYGHSWDDDPDGDLFAQLKRYRDEDFAREHPYLFFSTGEDNMVWEVFAVFDTTVDLLYNVPSLSDGKFFDILDIVYDASLYRYDVAVSKKDKILTLSTCVFSVEGHETLPAVNSYRFSIMARLVRPDDALKEEADFVLNDAPLAPDEITRLVNGGAVRSYRFGN